MKNKMIRVDNEFFSDKAWDIAGILFGLLGCLAILGQIISELSRQSPSSLSLFFVIGYVVVFAFWFLYGLRFKRPAIIVTNGIALILQLTLFWAFLI